MFWHVVQKRYWVRWDVNYDVIASSHFCQELMNYHILFMYANIIAGQRWDIFDMVNKAQCLRVKLPTRYSV